MVAAGCLFLAALVILPAPADAAFPGQNGKIAFVGFADGDAEIYTINPDGTGLTQLTHNTVLDEVPSWSADGSEIVFTRGPDSDSRAVWKMNADGSGQAMVRDTPTPNTPSWSPDDQQIAFSFDSDCHPSVSVPPGGVWTMDADGTDAAWLTCGAPAGAVGSACCTSWSPDGTRIVWSEAIHIPGEAPAAIFLHTIGGDTVQLTTFDSGFWRLDPDWSPNAQRIIYYDQFYEEPNCCPPVLVTMNPDGSGHTSLGQGSTPVWSPDGTKIAFLYTGSPSGIWTANADGTGRTFLTSGGSPSWQPIPINSYPRPKGATPLKVSMVPAYSQCMSANRTHGPPLAFPSCSSPAQTSDELTVGTADSNGKPTKGMGFVRYDALLGSPATPADEADVQIMVELSDVYEQGTLADYTGELRSRTSLRITDKLNTPHPGGPGAATVSDAVLGATVPCVATADATQGATCNLATTFDALVPGTVTESKRSIWALGAAQLDDGGADSDADTPADNTLFMTQGLFVP